MDKKKIIEKVVKLLALSENNSETEEVKSAKNMAAQLMAKYDIDIMEAKEKQKFETEERTINRICTIDYDATLFNVISKFNGVAYIKQQGSRHSKGMNIFVGTKVDIECNDYMIDVVLQQRNYLWKEHLADYKPLSDTQKKRWMFGFAFGVKAKLDKLSNLKNNKIQEYGLVPVNISQQALDEFLKKEKVIIRAGSKKFASSGFIAGKNVHIHSGIVKKDKIRRIA